MRKDVNDSLNEFKDEEPAAKKVKVDSNSDGVCVCVCVCVCACVRACVPVCVCVPV